MAVRGAMHAVEPSATPYLFHSVQKGRAGRGGGGGDALVYSSSVVIAGLYRLGGRPEN